MEDNKDKEHEIEESVGPSKAPESKLGNDDDEVPSTSSTVRARKGIKPIEEKDEKPEFNNVRAMLKNVLKPVKTRLKSEYDSTLSSSSRTVEDGDFDSTASISYSDETDDEHVDLSSMVKVRNKTKADNEKVRKFHLINSFTRLFPGLRKEFRAEAQRQQKELIEKNRTSLVRRPTIDEIGKTWGVDVQKLKPYFKEFTVNEADKKIHYDFSTVLGANMGRLLRTGQYSDIELHCGTFVFNVHSFVLSGQSDVFRRRLFFNSHLRPIVVVDLKPIEMAGFLHFLYTGIVIEAFQDPNVDGRPSKKFIAILKNYEVPYHELLKK